ncbi:MAG TPA: NADH-quinone oxidoreductase subunit C [bacterium]|nr:NADH-quinone oxidoreductase subunit C [bacterium]
MESIELQKRIESRFPGSAWQPQESSGVGTLVAERSAIVEVLRFLRDDPDLAFDFLMDLFGVDYLEMEATERFAVIYQLYSMKHGHRLRVKAFIPETSPAIDSVAEIYPAANWAERETYDQYGIRFNGHPDLRRILNPDDFTGHPLRKDFPVEGIGYRDQFEKITRTRAQ